MVPIMRNRAVRVMAIAKRAPLIAAVVAAVYLSNDVGAEPIADLQLAGGSDVPQATGSTPRGSDTTHLRRLRVHDAFRQGRPANFYRLSISNEPAICDSLNAALSEAQPPFPSESELLLGNRYAVKWTDLLVEDRPFPASRISIDLNNDGKQDVL